MAHRLDIVAVRIADEGREIVGGIFGAQARAPIVAPPGRQRRTVVGDHFRPAAGDEGDVKAAGAIARGADPELRPRDAEAGMPVALIFEIGQRLDAERPESKSVTLRPA
jgi:hypothetical protein